MASKIPKANIINYFQVYSFFEHLFHITCQNNTYYIKNVIGMLLMVNMNINLSMTNIVSIRHFMAKEYQFFYSYDYNLNHQIEVENNIRI